MKSKLLSIITGTVASTAVLVTGCDDNVKSPIQVQPYIWIYDTDRDGTPDRTVVGYRGGVAGAIPVIWERKPTQEEIDFYTGKTLNIDNMDFKFNRDFNSK